MSILVFRHVPFEPLGRIQDALDTRGIDWRYIDLWQPPLGDPSQGQPPEEDPPIDQAQALVFMGGPMSVNDELPWMRQEERFIARAISSGVPVLGICLGAQLLAKCLGSRVYPMGSKEIGWYPIRLTGVGMSDPIFEGLQQIETLFHWHGETFDLPAGSERLAESDICANQAFRYGSNLYGLQFHPEVTPEIISAWCWKDDNCGEPREAERPIDAAAHQDRMRETAAHIFGRWCDLVATR